MTRSVESMVAEWGVGGEIGVDAALVALDTSPRRMGTAWYGPCAEILYQGQWRQIARTDLKDDVCTGSCKVMTLDEWIAHYRKGVQFGARLRHNDTFAVIDRFSDG